MTVEQQVALWNAINHYVLTCGGDPSKYVYGNTKRQNAVAAVNRVIEDIAHYYTCAGADSEKGGAQ